MDHVYITGTVNADGRLTPGWEHASAGRTGFLTGHARVAHELGSRCAR